MSMHNRNMMHAHTIEFAWTNLLAMLKCLVVSDVSRQIFYQLMSQMGTSLDNKKMHFFLVARDLFEIEKLYLKMFNYICFWSNQRKT